MKKVVVVGGGAAGMMAAGTAAGRGLKVTLVEPNDRPGKKILITGKGRCNVTSSCSYDEFFDNLTANPKFMYSAFSAFSNTDVIEFFESLGVGLKIERGNRVFPESDRAADIAGALEKFAIRSGAEILRGRVSEVTLRDGERAVAGVRLADGKTVPADAVIVATGGLSYPGTGSTGDGYRMAQALGHTVTALRPSLVPLLCDDRWCAECAGLTLKNVGIEIRKRESHAHVFSDFGELLFTHVGVSGPVILSASAHMRDEDAAYDLYIDLKPAIDDNRLDRRVLRDFDEARNRAFKNSLAKLLPSALIPVIVRLSGINPDKMVNAVTREERGRLVGILKSLKLGISGFAPITEAVVTSGGVDVSEVSPSTMESKLVSGLYFAGEVLDVDGYTGGFNLQIAFSTGRLAGNSV